MVHKSSLLPGISKFIDENVLSHYPATSIKRIVLAGAVSLYLKQNEGIVDTLTSNPLFAELGVVHENGMVDIERIKETLKSEINKAGFMRITIPMIGDIDFTVDDVDALYKFIQESNTQVSSIKASPVSSTIIPAPTSSNINNGGVY